MLLRSSGCATDPEPLPQTKKKTKLKPLQCTHTHTHAHTQSHMLTASDIGQPLPPPFPLPHFTCDYTLDLVIIIKRKEILHTY